MNANTELLTIKEFAQAAGVSRQTIYNKLDKDLTAYLTEIDNVKYIDKAALSLFVSNSAVKFDSQIDKEFDNNLTGFDTNLTAILQVLQNQLDTMRADHAAEIDRMTRQIEDYKEQLRAKDVQIAARDSQIADLTQQLDHAQELHARTQATTQATVLMLTDKKKPGLFDRLFKKKQAAASDPGDDPTGDTPTDDNGSGTE